MAAINYSLAFLVLCGLLSDTYSLVSTAADYLILYCQSESFHKIVPSLQPLKRLTRSTSHIKKIREGDPIELHCTASGSTPPIIHWRFNSKYVQQVCLQSFTHSAQIRLAMNYEAMGWSSIRWATSGLLPRLFANSLWSRSLIKY